MRKIVQIVEGTDCEFIALCDDGTTWQMYYANGFTWLRYPDIPQEAPHED